MSLFVTVVNIVPNDDTSYNILAEYTDGADFVRRYTYIVPVDVTNADLKALVKADAARFQQELADIATPPPKPAIYDLIGQQFDVANL